MFLSKYWKTFCECEKRLFQSTIWIEFFIYEETEYNFWTKFIIQKCGFKEKNSNNNININVKPRDPLVFILNL